MTPEQFAQKLDPGAFAAAKRQVLDRIAPGVRLRAQAHTPVRTGRLRDSEEAVVEGDMVVLRSDVEYAAFIHKRVPFFELGLAESEGEIEQALQQIGEQIVEGWAG